MKEAQGMPATLIWCGGTPGCPAARPHLARAEAAGSGERVAMLHTGGAPGAVRPGAALAGPVLKLLSLVVLPP